MNSNEQQLLMQREGIELAATFPEFNLYRGAMKYFTTQNGSTVVDAILPMWYVRSLDKYETLLLHNADEVRSIPGAGPYLISGIKILMQNSQGMWCTTDCLQTRDDYTTVLSFNDGIRTSHSRFIGTSIFKWPFAPAWGPPAWLRENRLRTLAGSQRVRPGSPSTLRSGRACDHCGARYDPHNQPRTQSPAQQCPPINATARR